MRNNVPVILLGGENSDELQSLSNILIGQGYLVETLIPDAKAMDTFRKMEPDILILAPDNEMVFSLDLCRKLKAEADVVETPVLMVRNSGLSIAPLSISDDIFDTVLRPYDRETILARTKLLLRLGSMNREVKAVREELHSAQRFECVGALAAGVSHEFNNMMCSVMGFAELALESKVPDLEALRESAEVSYETAKRASATAASLLAFSRQVKSSKTRGDINDAVTAALRLLQRDLDKHGITTDLSLGELPKALYAQGPLQQVFLNLIINAWHAMSEIPGTRLLSIKSWCEGNFKISVSVADSGKGIHPSQHEKIFEPFYTTKTGSKPGEAKGSGLGLVIVKEVVRDHNGTVRVESEEGKGAKFIITIPVDTGEEADTGMRETPPAHGERTPDERHCSLLVVDDEEPSRHIITRLLQRQGHEVCTAANMAEAVGLLWSRKFDLIVLDLIMPNSDGPDNVKQLRDQEIDLPILICTGNTDTNLIQKAMDAGANGLVMKPFSIREFTSRMYACLATAKPASP